MSNLFECDQTNAKVVSAEIGAAKGKKKVRMVFELVEGPHAGRRASYDGKLDPENIKFTKSDMKKVGWKGVDANTFASDVAAAALVVPIDCEIVSYKYPDTGKTSEWTAVRNIGGARPLDPLAGDDLREVNQWFADAPELTPQPREQNGASRSSGRPPVDDSDLPF